MAEEIKGIQVVFVLKDKEKNYEHLKNCRAMIEKLTGMPIFFADEKYFYRLGPTFDNFSGKKKNRKKGVSIPVLEFTTTMIEFKDITWSDGSVTKVEDLDKSVILYDMQYNEDTNMMKMSFAKKVEKEKEVV